MGFRNPVTSVAGAGTADVATKALTVDTRASSTSAGVRAYNTAGRSLAGQVVTYTRGVVEVYDGQNATAPTFLSSEYDVGKVFRGGYGTHRARWSDGGHPDPAQAAVLPAYLEFSYDDTVSPPVSTAVLHAAQITLDGLTSSPRGLLAYGFSSTPVGAISGATRLSALAIPTVHLTSDRCYVHFAEARALSTVAGDVAALAGRITPVGQSPAATDPGLSAATAFCTATGANAQYPLTLWRPFQIAPGAAASDYQINLWGSRAAGTGTETISTAATGDFFHGIIDVGPALSTVPTIAI